MQVGPQEYGNVRNSSFECPLGRTGTTLTNFQIAMPDIIGTLLDVALKLFGFRKELSQARQNRKQQVADFLLSIAGNIETVSTEIKKGNYPHGTCQTLLSHSQQMVPAIGDLIGEQQANELAGQLKEVWEIESLFKELDPKPPEEKQRSLHVLDQCAGLFRATADFVRVSP